MKKDTHPDYHMINVKMTNGDIIKKTSLEELNKLKLDIDSKSHPAWTGGPAIIRDDVGQVAKFNKRFAGLKI